MKIQILKKFTLEVLFETEASSEKEALEKAIAENKNLRDANLVGADLRDANLRGANLGDAYLVGADLRGADLVGADLRGAYLVGADLRDAYLRDAKWDDTKKDMFEKMALMPNEVPYLYKSIHEGKVDGSAYEGECACFCGTLANGAGIKYEAIKIKADSSSPVEKFFLGINKGDIPKNNPISQLASEWIEEFCTENNIALPKMKIIWE